MRCSAVSGDISAKKVWTVAEPVEAYCAPRGEVCLMVRCEAICSTVTAAEPSQTARTEGSWVVRASSCRYGNATKRTTRLTNSGPAITIRTRTNRYFHIRGTCSAQNSDSY